MRQRNRGERKFDARIADIESHGACFLDMGQDQPAAPDNTALANASEESARIAAAQADRVLAESTRQYDRNMEVAQPVIDAQLGMMKSAKEQGDEYYDYWKTKAQPVEDSLNADAMAAGTEAKQQEKVDRAVADSQGGFTRAINQTIRQGKRYGMEPIATTGAMTVQQASNTAGMATGARDKEIALGTAKKLDVAGLYRGMPGASTGAYSSANQSGNSAVGNSTTVGNGMVAGTGAAAGLTMQGQGMKLQGMGNILSNQTSQYNAGQNQSSSLGGIGSMLGGAASLYSAFKGPALLAASSKKLKTDKTPVSAEVITKGLQRIPVEAWKYKDGEGDGGEHIGPYAEDVQREFGDVAAPGGEKIDLVSMNGLALAGIKSLADRMDKMENRVGMQRRGS
jgi:hypothetical protein